MDCLEAFYGGAAGGGKSSALLMAALQFVDIPNYAAVIFRQSYTDLALPGALMDRAFDWLLGTDAKWSAQEKRWTFPSGATLSFGYIESENDKYRYRSSEFQFIGFDELTNFTETQYRFLFSRLRRVQDIDVPLRMRSASNPGGVGHDWVKDRFVGSPDHPPEIEGVYVPATLNDNPHLDREEYTRSLMNLDPVTRAQLLGGDWEAYEGGMFQREWFEIVDAPPVGCQWCRSWDKGGTAGGGDPTAGVNIGKSPNGIYYIEDVVHGQWGSFERESIIKQTTIADAERLGERNYQVLLEQEGGSGGKHSAEITVKDLAGYKVSAERSTGDKSVRAGPLASQAQAGNVKLVRGKWNRAFLDELCLFPHGSHDDQVDAAASGFNRLALHVPKRLAVW
jgi:predicted phage terminase large subunit-like protein